MKKEIADKWVKALRSGKYKQGESYLKRNGNYCCLGVLCEISGVSKFKNSGFVMTPAHYYDGEDIYTPKSVLKWSGLTTKTGVIPQTKLLTDCGFRDAALTDLNDGDEGIDIDKLNFDEIADVIQMTYEDL